MIMDEEIIEDFVIEAKEHLDTVERVLLELEKNPHDDVPAKLNVLFRAVHSIKGAAGFLKLSRIIELSHQMENIFGRLREMHRAPDNDCADLILRSIDVLREMLDASDYGESAQIEEILGCLGACRILSTGGEDSAPTNARPASNSPTEYHYCIKLQDATNPELLRRDVASLAEIDLQTSAYIMVRSVLEPALLDTALSEFNITAKLLKPEDYTIFKEKLTASKAGTPAPAQTALAKVEPQLPLAPEKSAEVKSKTESTVRVNIQLLEQLMALAGELVLVRNRHLRWAGNNADSVGREISQRLDTVTTELQTTIMKTRMQPLERVFAKLPRLVREVAGKLGKQINLELNGGEVEVDRAILESLADPLTHLLRNSCDHGIEMPEARQECSKLPTGTIRVSASHESGQILIKVSDDGKGIDPNKIAKSAVEKGLITESEVENMDTRRKLALIMLPGFSTAAQISSISGRGVGMDVVKSSIEKLGGGIEIDSIPGSGTTMLLRLPLTLAIIQSLVIANNDVRYIIPRINLEEVVSLSGGDIAQKVHLVNGQEVMKYHRSLLQLVRLQEVFERPEKFTHETREEVAQKYAHTRSELECARQTMDIAVVRVGEYRYGLIVDQTLNMEEIVVKPLHKAQKNIGIFLGATVTGDGKVAPILDVEGIARHALDSLHYVNDTKHDEQNFAARSDEAQKMMLFECAQNERFAIGLSFIRRIHNIHSSDIQKIGSRWFVEINNVPITIARLEETLDVSPTAVQEQMYLIMPRFGSKCCGILASKICGINSLVIDFPETAHTNKGILGTISIDGATTIFPDIYHICEVNTEAQLPRENVMTTTQGSEKKKILLAEDAPFFRQLISNYLRRENIEIDTAANGAEALEKLKDKEYDLLLSDIEMPVVDGLELVKRIRSSKIRRNMPVVALTSLDTEEDKQQCLEAGFDEYMVKLNRELLLTTLSKHLS